MKKILKFTEPYLLHIILAVVASVGGAASSVWVIDIFKNIIDESMKGSVSDVIIKLAEGAVVLIIGMLCSYLVLYMTQYFGTGLLHDLRAATLKHVAKMSPDYMEKNDFGDMVARMSSDTEGIAGYLESYFKDSLYTPIMIVIYAVYLLSISPLLAFAGLIPLVILVPLSVKLMKPIKMSQGNYVRKVGETNNNIQEICDGIDVVKSYNLHKILENKYYKDLSKTLEISFKNDLWQYNVEPITRMINELPVIITLCLGGYLVFKGNMTLGVVVAFVSVMKKLIEPLGRAYQLILRTQFAFVLIERVLYILDAPIEYDAKESLIEYDAKDSMVEYDARDSFAKYQAKDISEEQRSIETTDDIFCLKNVDFAYEGMVEQVAVLQDINLRIKRNHKVAFVGRSGGGKSTLLKLLYKNYPVKEGTIEYMGVEYNKIDPDRLRAGIALISQDAFLFPMTIEDNIRIGDPDATKEDIIKAAKIANCHEFIEKLPNGYATLAGEKGTFLSGGQRQRISIARAVLKDAPVILLDEPTSALDKESERLVNEALDKLAEGKTVVVIAHRLPTITNADEIVVIDDGRIVEQGIHTDLMKRDGLYSRLYTEYVSNGGVAG